MSAFHLGDQNELARISALMRAGRKLNGLTQTEASTRLAVSQSMVSKIEAGKLEPNITLWFNAAKLYGFNADHAFQFGFIDHWGAGNLEQRFKNSSFSTPKSYKTDPSISIRALLPFLDFLNEKNGKKAMTAYFKRKKIDPDWLLVLDQHTNEQLLIDLLNDLFKDHHFTTKDYDLLGQLSVQSTGLRTILKPESKSDEWRDIYALYAKNISSLFPTAEATITWQSPKLGILVQKRNIEPLHVSNSILCQWEASHLKRLPQTWGMKQIDEAKESSCQFKGDATCTFHLRSA